MPESHLVGMVKALCAAFPVGRVASLRELVAAFSRYEVETAPPRPVS